MIEDKLMGEKLYKKESCIECNGTGETDSWNGPCYKCLGKGYVFEEVEDYHFPSP